MRGARPGFRPSSAAIDRASSSAPTSRGDNWCSSRWRCVCDLMVTCGEGRDPSRRPTSAAVRGGERHSPTDERRGDVQRRCTWRRSRAGSTCSTRSVVPSSQLSTTPGAVERRIRVVRSARPRLIQDQLGRGEPLDPGVEDIRGEVHLTPQAAPPTRVLMRIVAPGSGRSTRSTVATAPLTVSDATGTSWDLMLTSS